ncbi:PepSY-associated TM helix domain-containing protein [Aureispira anguillae]|nr:PepSY-associated TM helix domain-containing protein [Aureispira anguillae]
MAERNNRKQQAKILRNFRKLHRITGALLFIFFFFMAVTGGALGWKKNSAGYLLPKTQRGSSTHLNAWLPLDSLNALADGYLRATTANTNLLPEVHRIDIRKNKGVAKFIYVQNYWEVQIDGTTGQLLGVNRRYSDLLEDIHDGSILDDLLGCSNGFFKLLYTSIMGLALLLFTITGFWLWYGPKRMRQEQRKR